MDYPAPVFGPPHRVLLLVAATDGWYGAGDGERGEALDNLRRLLDGLRRRGARIVGSFDDDLFLTGQPAPLPYTIFVLLDVDQLAHVVEAIHEVRSSELGRYLRVEARIGRPLFVLEQ